MNYVVQTIKRIEELEEILHKLEADAEFNGRFFRRNANKAKYLKDMLSVNYELLSTLGHDYETGLTN